MLQQAQTAAADVLVKDTTTQAFVKDVIEESKRQPVLVDFWAPWCGPCKQLTPVLEKAVRAAKGKVKLVKMNIDDHPAIPGQMGIQSIPAVIAFRRRPAGRRLYGGAAGKPSGRISRSPHQGEHRRRDQGSAQGRRRGAGRRRSRRSGEPLCAAPRRGQRQRPGARRPGALLRRDRSARPGAADAGHDPGFQTRRIRCRRRASRAAIGRAGEDARARSPSWSKKSPPIRSTIRRASIWRWRSTARVAGSTPSISSSASSSATANGTTTAPASNSSSSSRHGVRPTKPRSRAASGCPRSCSRSLSSRAAGKGKRSVACGVRHADQCDLQGARRSPRRDRGIPVCRGRYCCRAGRCRSISSSRAIWR